MSENNLGSKTVGTMPPKTPKTPRAKGKTPAKGRSKSKDDAAPFGASPAALLGALVALVVAVLLATSNLGFVVATIRGSAAGEDASPGGGGGGAPPASPASSPASSRTPAAGAGGAPASLGDDETARLIASVLPRRSAESSEGGVADHDLSLSDDASIAALGGRAAAAAMSSPVMLNTANFADALKGRVAVVLFRSVANKRIRLVRDAISQSFELMPPGAVTLFGEVDVKSDSLLRLRYSPGIEYAGRGDSRKKGERKKRPGSDDDEDGYEFGRKRMLLRQMQITLFRGLTPVGVFRDPATPANIAAFASSAALARGHVARLSRDTATRWLRCASPARPVVVACASREESATVASLAAASFGDEKSAPGDGDGARGAVVRSRRARVGYLSDEKECAAVVGWRGPPGGGREARVFTAPLQKTPAKEGDAAVVPLSLLGEAIDDVAGVETVRVSWENEYDSFVGDDVPMRFKPLVVLLRPGPSSRLGETVGGDAIEASEDALRAAMRLLPPARRRMAHWFIADIDAYRGYLWKPCDSRGGCGEAFVVAYIHPSEDDRSEGRYLEALDTEEERQDESIAANVVDARDAATGSALDPGELARKVNLLIDTSAVMMGGVERAVARADELEARLGVFEQDGRRNQEHDLEEDEDEDEEDEDGEKKEEKDADGVKEDEPADPDEFDFPTLSDESKRGMATTRMHAVVYHCNHWADAIKNVQEYVNSLSHEEREKRSAVVNGVAEIDAMIRACHGESILDHPKDLEALAQAGKWRRFKKEIEDLYSKRVRAKVAELSSTPGAVTQQTVSELEKIQDSIGKAFAAMIKNAEAELIARTPGGKDGLRLTTTPVPVKHADDLTLEEFVEEHAIPGKPVVIRGLKMINPDKPWTLEHIADACGGVKVRLNTKSATTTNWGGLVDAGRMPLNDFARRVETDPALRTWYLHDWSLNRYCPAIFGPPPYTEFTMPKYFAGDYFQRVPWIGYEQTWPSLFIGANATSSALHVDSGATNFWMYLMTGKKLWRFWDREQLFNLYHKPFTAHFRFRAFDVDLSRNPLLADAPMYEVVQEPGDLVFVPANSPHAVHNLDDITALSMNYVDSTNLWLYLADLVKDEAWEEIEMFDVDTAPFGLVKSQKDLSFGEFKSQRVTWERRNAEYRAGERFAKGERVPVWLD